MRCSAVQERLVALEDEELAPSEAAQIREHVERCARCRSVERRLSLPPLGDALVVPPEVTARLLAATAPGDLLAAAADPARQPRLPLEPRWRRWLLDAVEVPGWSVLAAAAALLLVGAYAWQVGRALEQSQAELAARATPGSEVAPIDLPADQFQPASFQPTDAPPYR